MKDSFLSFKEINAEQWVVNDRASLMSHAIFMKVPFENKKFIWPKKTLFDFKIAPAALQFLPLTRALPKHELFASIDDGNAVPNTKLISSALYPVRVPELRMTAPSAIRFINPPFVEKKP